MMISTASGPELPSPPLALEVFACLTCGGTLEPSEDVLRCRECQSEYPVRLGVPLLVTGCEVVAEPKAVPEATMTALAKAYGIPDDGRSRHFFEQVLGWHYRFADSALDSENNLLLHRVGIETQPVRCVEQQGLSSAAPHWQMVRHYIPPKLTVDLETSFNVRIKNSGDGPLISDWKEGRGYSLVPRWMGAEKDVAEDEDSSPVPVSLPPGEEVTVPVYFKTPARAGSRKLQIALLGPDAASPVIDPVEVVVNIKRPPWPLIASIKKKWFGTASAEVIRRPAIEGYDADHHEAIRIVHEEAARRGSRNGLEIGGCSTPMTTNLPCQIVSTDIDVQTLQVGRYIFAHRGHDNVTFVCCDSHKLPFQPASFDFVAIFAALHHFSDPVSVLNQAAKLMRADAFMAVMCEPVGHYRGQPDEECMGQMELGVNEQRFSLEEYDRMFRGAGLQAMSTQIDHDSLKCILQLRRT